MAEQASIEIERRPEDIFAIVSDLTNLPRWHTQITGVGRLSGAPGELGESGTLKVRWLVGEGEATYRVTDVQPNERVAVSISQAAFAYEERIAIEAIPSGSRVTCVASPRNALARATTGWLVSQDPAGSLARLKELLESSPRPADEELRREALRHRLETAQSDVLRMRRIRRGLRIMAMVVVVASGAATAFMLGPETSLPITFFVAGLAYAAVFLLMSSLQPVSEKNLEIRNLETELEIVEIQVDPQERRAERQFRLHQAELEKYYRQAREHAAWIFYVGIASLALGFAIVAFALVLVLISDDSGVEEKILLAALGAVGGFLSNFIAVILVRMYSGTIESLSDFHNKLVMTHHLHFANFLTAKIATSELREQTISQLVSSIAAAPAATPADASRDTG